MDTVTNPGRSQIFSAPYRGRKYCSPVGWGGEVFTRVSECECVRKKVEKGEGVITQCLVPHQLGAATRQVQPQVRKDTRQVELELPQLQVQEPHREQVRA